MASSTLPSGTRKRSNSVGRTNWQLGDITGSTRLAEDIAILNQKLGSSPLSPEDTADTTQRKGKASQSNHQEPVTMRHREFPPHLKNQTPTHTPFPGTSLPKHVPATPAPQQAPPNDRDTIAKELRDFEEAEFHLKQNKLVQSAIQSSNTIFRSRNILKADGSNFGDWYRNLSEVGRIVLRSPLFFFEKCDNSTYEKIGRVVLMQSVHDSLGAEMQTLKTTFDMYTALQAKFKTSSRAAQMNIWFKFCAFKIDPLGHNAGISSSLRDLHAEWMSVNVKFGIDAFMGFVLQAAVMESSAGYKTAFETRVENLVQADPSCGCTRHLQGATPPHHGDVQPNTSLATSHPPSVFAASVYEDQPFEAGAFLTEIGEEDWVDALDFYALTASKCWQCGDENHYARNCPDKSSGKWPPSQLNSISQDDLPKDPHPPYQTSRTCSTTCGLLPSPVQSSRSRSTQQSHSTTPQGSTKGGVSAQLVEAWSLPDDLDELGFNNMSLGEDLVSNVAVFDTGASHGFTGSKSLLHDFRSLSKPIGVSVATNGAGSFITGMGSLKFQAPDGRIIVLRQVLYCEQAKTTLISMAALRKANALVAYDNNTDTFRITRSNGEHLFDCAFEPSKNRWCMPYPMIRLDVVNTDPVENRSRLISQIHTDKTVSSTSLSPTPSREFSSTHSPVSSLSFSSHVQTQSGSPAHSFSQSPHSPLPGNEISILASKAKAPPPIVFPEPLGKATDYQWKPETLTNDEVKLLYYHRAFGHASLRHIRKIIKLQLGNGLPEEIPQGKIHCPVCAISKSTQVNPLTSTLRKIERLDVMAADLIGPFQVDSIDGGKYLLTMRDVATGYAFAKVLKRKNDANGHIINIITRLEQATGKRVGTLRSDNGGEFANQELFDFLALKGIAAEKSLPYHHYQNGMIERFNRTIADMGRTILIDSPLPKEFWSYSFVWAAHVLNRLPNKASGDKTPFEALFNRKPQYDHFRVFGSTGYIHIPHEKRQKLDDRALKGFVIAHLDHSKGWLFWLPDEHKFVCSAMVRFPPELRDVPVVKQAKEQEILPSSPKLSVDYIMNLLQLGDFSREIEFTNQELIVDKIIDLCRFYAISVPKTFKQAMNSSDKEAWSKAIAIELSNLEEMRVWVLQLQPPDKRPLGGRWVFATKPDTDGSGVRFKARYVAKGFTQVEGQDFLKTFAPTATFVSLRLLMVVAGAYKWPVQSFDFVAAYLNSPIDEEVWVKPPEGMKTPPGHALLLKKALYGTRQAARCWWLHLKNVLDKFGYSPSQYDNSLYILRHPDETGVVWLHVDDGVVTASNIKLLKKLEDDLKDILKIKWSHSLDSIVGLNVVRSDRGFQLYQQDLVNSILAEHWDGVSKANTPLPSNYNATTDENGDSTNSGKYLSVIGSLSYLAVGTRPDICFAVNYLARFAAKPGVLHWKGVQHLINYLADSRELRLSLFPSADLQPLKAFADASWGGEFSRSSYGVLITFLNCPVLWVSRRQQSVASSTCHAEYMALGVATRQALWVRHLLRDVLKRDYVGHLFCDNQAAIKVSTDDASNKRTRHTDRDFYITNEALFQKKTSLEWVGTKDQLADIFTKCMTPDSFMTLRCRIMTP
ncbi:hypothetical protein PSHT_09061 [Puccinia striiformis]|uniref:Uncharacterized protein n=1 Tax=Puccinia striiformis TaxID=27350 RepID=A0A2S4VJQ7_9BASI|nr:hypothetical protein PSHT_09061 [Puccinia striiformis]